MSKRILLTIVLMIMLLIVGCGTQEPYQEPPPKPVETIILQEEQAPLTLSYLGTVGASQVRKLSFKGSGRIASMLVQQGDVVVVGQTIAILESRDYQYGLQAAKGRLDSVRAQYDKAVAGAMEEEINQLKSMVRKAQAAYDYTAQADFQQKKSLLQDTELVVASNGKVLEVLAKEGEIVSSGFPVAVVAGAGQLVNVGVVEGHLSQIELGTKARIIVGDKKSQGLVTHISPLPDRTTRTYNLEIALEEDCFNLGAVAGVELVVGESGGIWIPITSIMVDGNDYVYVVEANRAVKKLIQIEQVKGTRVKVQGLNPGEQLVVGGMKKLMPNDLVTAAERGSEQL